MTVRILTGDCRDVLKTLPAESVDCVVTSPTRPVLRWHGGKWRLARRPAGGRGGACGGCDAGRIVHTGPVDTGFPGPAITQHATVRRLTPRECERLQGMPDDYTAVTYRGKPAADGPRYKAIGNSMAVPVVRWILKRIAIVDGIMGARQPTGAE